jgi:UDP-glucose 4-epimerase
MKIVENIVESLSNININKFIYLSSDAVYKDSTKLINENSICEPDSLHGLMHLAREKYLESFYKNKICIVRPTLVYGINDPHNGYGPNMFLRKALKNQNILLFGKGEERRDHVYVEDVGKIISFLILNNIKGKFNITSGNLLSFKQIALMTKKIVNTDINIEYKKRIGPMPHNGYRAFNNIKILEKYKGFKFKKIDEWLTEQ